jgi:LysR family cyn operon transcriptional activator
MISNNVNLELYRVFYYTAQLGSFSRAASALFITQPAVSHAIKQLEEKLGGELFFRGAKGVKLTKEGEVLLRYIEQAFHSVAMGELKISEMHQLQSGSIRIGASDTLCRHFMLPYLEQFHRSYPQVKLHVTNRTSPETIKLLKEGAIDFGLVNLPVMEAGIHVTQGMAVHDVLVAGPKYAAFRGIALTWEELIAYPIILLERGSSTRSYVDKSAEKNGVRLIPEIELGSLDLLVQFAKIGLGLSCVTREFVEKELQQGELFEVLLDKPIPARHIGVVTLKEVPLPVAAQKLLELLGFGTHEK